MRKAYQKRRFYKGNLGVNVEEDGTQQNPKTDVKNCAQSCHVPELKYDKHGLSPILEIPRTGGQATLCYNLQTSFSEAA